MSVRFGRLRFGWPRLGRSRALALAIVSAGALGAVATGPGVRSALAQVTVRSAVSATRIPVGETVDWVISVDGAMGAEAPVLPEIDFARVQELGSSQNMSWVNGRASARTVFQFRLTPVREGSFSVPAVRVRAGGRVYTTDAIAVEITPAQPGSEPSFGQTTGTRLRLVASVEPSSAVVGQPVVLTMRLFQGTRLLGDPQYTAPETPRFFVEPTGAGRTYYEGSGAGRWLVGERRTVMYPTVSGKLTIGHASMTCLVASLDRPDGFEVELESAPQTVDVQPLPAAPGGAHPAVADIALVASVDRTTVRSDESVLLTYRLEGSGNLRLAPVPDPGAMADFEVFDRSVEDSLDVESGRAAGAKIVRYTLLPRRSGPLVIPGLRYWTYVPGEGYRALDAPARRIDVTAGLHAGARARASTAAALAPVADPGGSPWRGARPYAGAAILALGFAAWCARVRRADAAAGANRAAHEARAGADLVARMTKARARSDAAEFWRSAEQALADVGAAAAPLRARIAEARYAPGGGDARAMDTVSAEIERALAERRRALEKVARAGSPAWARIAAAAFALLAIALAGLGVRAAFDTPADAELRATLASASRLLAANRIPDARRALVDVWNEGGHRPGVAADLALASFYERRLGEAALWTERARRIDPRHPLVIRLVTVLENEGAWKSLPTGSRARTTSGELGFVACVLAGAALLALAFGRGRRAVRWTGLGLLVLAAALGVWAARSGAEGEAPGRGVVLADTPLANTPGGSGDVELEAGRAVWLEGTAGGWTRVRAGGQVHGFVPAERVRGI